MLISVITPVYNAEKYLAECLGSILAQRMSDFELLLIDDGSTDASGAICDRFAGQDSRIRVFHTSNQGVSAARNLGLDNAQGEFVVFIDSDDRVTPDHLQQFIDSGIGENGIAFTNLLEERPSKGETPRTRLYNVPDCYVTGGRQACMPILAHLLRVRCFGWTWNKMFSRTTIEKHGLRFDKNIRYAEDEIFTAQYCAHITHIVCNSNPTYYYRYVPTSLLRGKIDPVMLMRIRLHIHEQYTSLGYCDEILYLTTRTQFSRLRRELRQAKGWNAELANELAQGILDNWKFYRAYVRSEFRKGFYDTKALWIARLSCMINSRLWVKLVIKGLHM